mmetsp:Transcript_26245/g.44780  ORF Transcript_26245/g.44780 Transcript_26245/m.44780 type:complete len:238 (-) Transcript_26245:371-1084(-)
MGSTRAARGCGTRVSRRLASSRDAFTRRCMVHARARLASLPSQVGDAHLEPLRDDGLPERLVEREGEGREGSEEEDARDDALHQRGGALVLQDALHRAGDAARRAARHQPSLDHVHWRHDHRGRHAAQRAEREVLLVGRRLARDLLEQLLRLREEHERERVPRHVARDGRRVPLVEPARPLGRHERLETGEGVRVYVRLNALLQHLLGHADDRRAKCADGAGRHLGERSEQTNLAEA